ncbi:MAG: zinc-binding dehydrogenase [Chloroflexota bacterium]
MPTIRAVVADPATPGFLSIQSIEAPVPTANQALVRVAAISLNRGETRRALTSTERWVPGWDFGGVVERAAADGSGPKAGQRVVGILATGGWAELVAVPADQLAVLPDNVTFAQASTLPVAGLTALFALEKNGSLLARRVLVTGASGGVGHLGIQLAVAAGAHVTAQVRQAAHAAFVKAAGAHEAVVGELAAAPNAGRFHLVVESVGGVTLSQALAALAPGGACVTLGVSASTEATIDLRSFFNTGRTAYYGFSLFREFGRNPANEGLARLAALVSDGRLKPHIDIEVSWTEIGAVAKRYVDRQFPGKAVLLVS